MAAIAAEAPAHAESFATKLLRVLSKSPVHIVLLVVGLLWLVPTFGLFVTSLNLLPAGQLDGGHVLYAVVGRRTSLLPALLLA